jgi:hypothetical protein
MKTIPILLAVAVIHINWDSESFRIASMMGMVVEINGWPSNLSPIYHFPRDLHVKEMVNGIERFLKAIEFPLLSAISFPFYSAVSFSTFLLKRY